MASSETDDSSISNNNNNNKGCDYDHVRNMALMFFLDRMFMSKTVGREVRTLHDLSCLFGAKGFTKEMRQVVGASRSGLKRFLSAYPSLFTIDGDRVYLTQINEGPNGANGRDYEQEAVEYFEKKLVPFGNALVPIKNLFGYRSQATQEVRHVSGQNTKEFMGFLARHTDVFETHEDYVVLKSVIQDVESRGESRAAMQRVIEEDVIDPYLMKQFTLIVENCLKDLLAGRDLPPQLKVTNCDNANEDGRDGSGDDSDTEHPVSVQDLHAKLRQEYNNELFNKMTRTQEDLKVFLRMHPEVFKRFKIADIEYVSLVPEHVRQQSEQSSSSSNAFRAPLRRSNNTNACDEQFSSIQSTSTTTYHDGSSDKDESYTLALTTTSNDPEDRSLLEASNAPLSLPPMKLPATTKLSQTTQPQELEQPQQSKCFASVQQNEPQPTPSPSSLTSAKQALNDQSLAQIIASCQKHPESQCKDSMIEKLNDPVSHSPSLSDDTSKSCVNSQDDNHTLNKSPSAVPVSTSPSQNNPISIQESNLIDTTTTIAERTSCQDTNNEMDSKHNSLYSRSSSTTTQTTGGSNLRASAAPFIPRSSLNKTPTIASTPTPPANVNGASKLPLNTSYSLLNQPTDINHFMFTHSSGPTSLNSTVNQSMYSETSVVAQTLNQGKIGSMQAAQRTPRRTIDPRAVVRSYLMRAVADNSSFDNRVSDNQRAFNSLVPNINSSNRDTFTRLPHYRSRIISTTTEAQLLVQRILHCTDTVGFGFNGASSGQINLIQLGYVSKKFGPTCATSNINDGMPSPASGTDKTQSNSVDRNDLSKEPQVYLLDVLGNKQLLEALRPLLESNDIVKVIHDVRNKSNALYNETGILIRNVFDTQVANLVIQQQDTGKPAYKSRYISSGKLCEIYGGPFVEQYHHTLRHCTQLYSRNGASALANIGKAIKSKDAKYWSTRPITELMYYESTHDIYCIIGCVYESFRSKLKPEYLSLFDQLNREGILAKIKPDEIKSLKRERKADLELIELKRKLYNSNGPIVLSNREIRLLRHVDLTNEVRSKIQQCQKVAKKLERLDEKAHKLSEGLSLGDCSLATINNSSDTSSSANFASYDDDYDDNDNSNTDVNGQHEQSGKTDCDEFDYENGCTSLIDSSMFDAIKNTIIESTDIIESDFDSIGGSSCHCHCHTKCSKVDVSIQCNLLQ
ncbi:Egalitarian protein-like protein, partial [Fragariocoptes setiger]